MSAWIDQRLNFKQHTNNRVESQHALLKSYLRSKRSTMDKFIPVINTMVLSQEKAIKQSFTDSKIRVMNHHNIELFSMILGFVSHSALEHLTKETDRLQKLLDSHYPCGCRLYNSCGLPCACRIQNYLQTGISSQSNYKNSFMIELYFVDG